MKQNCLALAIGGCVLLLTNSVQAQTDLQAKLLLDALVAHDSISAVKIVPLVNSVDYRDYNNSSLLMIASKYGFAKVCETLIEKGAKLDLQDNYGNTALIYATSFNKIEVINLLISKGANLNLKNKSNKNALMIASQNGYTGVVYLLQGKSDKEISPQPNIVDKAKDNPTVAQKTYSYKMDNSQHRSTGKVLGTISYLCIGTGLACYGAAWIIGENGGKEPTEESAAKSQKAYQTGRVFAAIGGAGLILNLFIKPSRSYAIRDYYKNWPKINVDKAFIYANSCSTGVGLKFSF